MSRSSFSPCTDGVCKGRDRSGWGCHECRNCVLTELENEVERLRFRIRNELEPRIASEKRAYDHYVTSGGINDARD